MASVEQSAAVEATQVVPMDETVVHTAQAPIVTDLARSNSRANNLLSRVNIGQITEAEIPNITAQIAIQEGDELQPPQQPPQQATQEATRIINQKIGKIAEIPKWQNLETTTEISRAKTRAQRLTKYAANLNRYRETISTAAVDIATYNPHSSLTGENMQTVLRTVTAAQSTIDKHPLLKK